MVSRLSCQAKEESFGTDLLGEFERLGLDLTLLPRRQDLNRVLDKVGDRPLGVIDLTRALGEHVVRLGAEQELVPPFDRRRRLSLDELLERVKLGVHPGLARARGDARLERLHARVGPHLVAELDVAAFLNKLEVAGLALRARDLVLGSLGRCEVRVDGRRRRRAPGGRRETGRARRATRIARVSLPTR